MLIELPGTPLTSIKVNRGKTLHHEEHRDHEDFSRGCWYFLENPQLFFVSFVSFVFFVFNGI